MSTVEHSESNTPMDTTKLCSYFGELVMFQCKHCYVGTIVYHKNCYLLKVLSGILGEQKKCVEKK